VYEVLTMQFCSHTRETLLQGVLSVGVVVVVEAVAP
jgi:hypothetical protein